MDAGLHRLADTCACSVIIVVSNIKHCNAGLWMFAARTFQKSKVAGSYCWKMVHYDLSSGEHATKFYGNGGEKMDAARLSKYALQFQMQKRLFERAPERIGSKKL